MGALLFVVVVLLGLILVSLWVFLYQLVKQQGRLLLRLDEVEHRLPSRADAQPQSSGLAVGTAVSSFRLPNLDGETVGLEDFRGKRVLLIHWSPQCGYCDLIAPDLARLQADLEVRNVKMVLLSNDDAESNRKLAERHGLHCPILLLKDSEKTVEAFEQFGTPVAYLLDEQGRVATPIAVGADRVPGLAQQAAADPSKKQRKRLPGERPLSESRIERNGLKAGTRAPVFRLPDLYGRTVSLEDYRGRPVLLVFTDPHCGPCEQLAPDLVRLHEQYGVSVIMIARGEAEENRIKAESYGFKFPVLLQEGWKLSKEYGIFAAPVAFRINEDGVIARSVAKGPDEILTLAHDARS